MNEQENRQERQAREDRQERQNRQKHPSQNARPAKDESAGDADRTANAEAVENVENADGSVSAGSPAPAETSDEGGEDVSAVHPRVSQAVIRRLPRYYRYLRQLIREGTTRVSSGELSEKMNVTASQIRQDLNCFGGFGQQGYGYNVSYLYTKIGELLGVGAGFRAVIVGAGNLGSALVGSAMFEKRGVDILSMFDVDPNVIGTEKCGVTVRSMDELENFCRRRHIDIAVLTLPKDQAVTVAGRLTDAGVRGLWNFTGVELERQFPSVVTENVHLGDSLMILNYELHAGRDRGRGKQKKGKSSKA